MKTMDRKIYSPDYIEEIVSMLEAHEKEMNKLYITK